MASPSSCRDMDICKGDKPYFCAHNCMCYGYEQFCSKSEDKLQDCLPQVNAQEWCRENKDNPSAWPNPQCAKACSSRFNESSCLSELNPSTTVEPATTVKPATTVEPVEGMLYAISSLTDSMLYKKQCCLIIVSYVRYINYFNHCRMHVCLTFCISNFSCCYL